MNERGRWLAMSGQQTSPLPPRTPMLVQVKTLQLYRSLHKTSRGLGLGLAASNFCVALCIDAVPEPLVVGQVASEMRQHLRAFVARPRAAAARRIRLLADDVIAKDLGAALAVALCKKLL